MKSIYDIINEAKTIESVYVVKGPDDAIVGMADTKEEAEKIKADFDKDAGGDVFVVSQESAEKMVEDK